MHFEPNILKLARGFLAHSHQSDDKNCSRVTSKQLSNRCNRRDKIRNVNEHYYAAVNPHWTIVTKLEHIVAKQPQKINQVFVPIFILG